MLSTILATPCRAKSRAASLIQRGRPSAFSARSWRNARCGNSSTKTPSWCWGGAELFDGTGNTGVWDVLDREIGVKNVPPGNTIPWTLALFTGNLVVQLWADGAARVRLGTGCPGAADVALRLLRDEFSGQDRRASDFHTTAATNPIRVRYGVRSEKARQRDGRTGFRSGERSSRR